MPKPNTSGTTGVYLEKIVTTIYYKNYVYKYKRLCWTARWETKMGPVRCRFSVKKYGSKEAKRLAIIVRKYRRKPRRK
jgi:hypothetical protein